MLLLAKLILVPTLIAAVTLAARRWGPHIAGLLTSLPVVGGPILVIYALEQGGVFAARAAEATLLGLIAVVAFCIAYATVAMRTRWPLSVLSGWLAFTFATALLYFTRFPLIVDLAITFAVLLTSCRLLPTVPAEDSSSKKNPVWDLPLRMLAAGTLVLVLTAVADRLGPNLSGVLTPFPIATAIFAGFTHAQRGLPALMKFFHAFIPGLTGFATFCFVLAIALPALGLWPALGCALVTQFPVQFAVLLLGNNRRESKPSAA
jgi:hypothetical protein